MNLPRLEKGFPGNHFPIAARRGTTVLSIALLAFSALAFGGEGPAPSPSEPPEPEVEKTGIVVSKKSNLDWNRWMGDRILVLVCNDGTYSLLRGFDKRVLTRIEPLVGKEITVKGRLVLKKRRHPRPGLKVLSFVEGKPFGIATPSEFLSGEPTP